MKKFCCSYWKSIVEQLQSEQGEELGDTEHISNGLRTLILDTVSEWPNYCPSCGLSLSSPDTSQGVNIKLPLAQSTHSLTCKTCQGTGNLGKAKCTPCLGTGRVHLKKGNSIDPLVKIEELKNKIRREDKPVNPESLNPDLIK